MPAIEIDDIEDPRLVPYRNVRDAALRRERGLFMAEGRLVVESLLCQARFRADSVFLTARSHAAMLPFLTRRADDLPVYVAKRTLFNQIVGFDLHRGCLAAGVVGDPLSAETLIETARSAPSILVVLEGLTNTENVGGVFRNAMAFGATGVLLCPSCCDPLYRKSIRVSMGATLQLPFARFETWPDPLSQIRAAGYRLVALDLAEDAIALPELEASIELGDRVALLLGTEGRGISSAALSRVDCTVRIPMAPGVDSVNVATASGIALQALYARSRGSGARA